MSASTLNQNASCNGIPTIMRNDYLPRLVVIRGALTPICTEWFIVGFGKNEDFSSVGLYCYDELRSSAELGFDAFAGRLKNCNHDFLTWFYGGFVDIENVKQQGKLLGLIKKKKSKKPNKLDRRHTDALIDVFAIERLYKVIVSGPYIGLSLNAILQHSPCTECLEFDRLGHSLNKVPGPSADQRIFIAPMYASYHHLTAIRFSISKPHGSHHMKYDDNLFVYQVNDDEHGKFEAISKMKVYLYVSQIHGIAYEMDFFSMGVLARYIRALMIATNDRFIMDVNRYLPNIDECEYLSITALKQSIRDGRFPQCSGVAPNTWLGICKELVSWGVIKPHLKIIHRIKSVGRVIYTGHSEIKNLIFYNGMHIYQPVAEEVIKYQGLGEIIDDTVTSAKPWPVELSKPVRLLHLEEI